MFYNNISYNEPLYRPPAEAYSAIIQVTLGCSHNKCSFCEMYKSKQFKIRNIEDIKRDIDILSSNYPYKKIFLADADAFMLSPRKLIPILEHINLKFNNFQRISSYALPRNILSKSQEDLVKIRNLGLKLLYIGIETGDDELLKKIHKGETQASTIEAINKLNSAGIDCSVMIINGLGGKTYSEQHARNSAEVINKTSPKFLSTLTLSFPNGKQRFLSAFGNDFEQQTLAELFIELRDFIEYINTDNVIFRSNHVSNNLNIKATLSRDKQEVIQILNQTIERTPNIYPPEIGML